MCYGNALYAASEGGYEKVVQTLLERGADVNAQGGGYYSNALQAASVGGHEKVVSDVFGDVVPSPARFEIVWRGLKVCPLKMRPLRSVCG